MKSQKQSEEKEKDFSETSGVVTKEDSIYNVKRELTISPLGRRCTSTLIIDFLITVELSINLSTEICDFMKDHLDYQVNFIFHSNIFSFNCLWALQKQKKK